MSTYGHYPRLHLSKVTVGTVKGGLPFWLGFFPIGPLSDRDSSEFWKSGDDSAVVRDQKHGNLNARKITLPKTGSRKAAGALPDKGKMRNRDAGGWHWPESADGIDAVPAALAPLDWPAACLADS